MNNSKYKLTDSDIADFENMFEQLGLTVNPSLFYPNNQDKQIHIKEQETQAILIKNKDYPILTKIEDITAFVNLCFVTKTRKLKPYIMVKIRAYLLREIAEINRIFEV